MFSGVAASSDGFSIKIRRLGNTTTITGSFSMGANTVPNTTIASIPYSTVGLGTAARATTNIYFSMPEIANSTGNGGFRAYVKAYVAGDTHLEIRTLYAHRENVICAFTVTYINQ